MDEPLPSAATSARSTRLGLALLLLGLSAALAILPAVSARGPETSPDPFGLGVLGIVIVVVSLLGIAAALRPRGCNTLLGLSRAGSLVGSGASGPPGCTARGFAGHHPTCEAFGRHTLRTGGRVACAGCTGMVAGGVAGILLGLALASGLVPRDPVADAVLGLAGLLLALAGFLGAQRTASGASTRVVANAVLVTGSVALASSLAVRGLLPGAFGLAAALAVLGLRVDVSRLSHLAACSECVRQPRATSGA